MRANNNWLLKTLKTFSNSVRPIKTVQKTLLLAFDKTFLGHCVTEVLNMGYFNTDMKLRCLVSDIRYYKYWIQGHQSGFHIRELKDSAAFVIPRDTWEDVVFISPDDGETFQPLVLSHARLSPTLWSNVLDRSPRNLVQRVKPTDCGSFTPLRLGLYSQTDM